MREEISGPGKDGQAGETGADPVRVRKSAVTPLSTIFGCPACGRPVVMHHTPMVEVGKAYSNRAACNSCEVAYYVTSSVEYSYPEPNPDDYETMRKRMVELLSESGVTGPIAAEQGDLVLALTDFALRQGRPRG